MIREEANAKIILNAVRVAPGYPACKPKIAIPYDVPYKKHKAIKPIIAEKRSQHCFIFELL